MARDFFSPDIFKKKKEEKLELPVNSTPEHLRIYGDKMVNLICKKFSVEGKEKIEKEREENPQEKFIITAAHLNNLDVPAALKVWGDKFNIQITGESILLEKTKYLAHRAMITLAGRDNFTALNYREGKAGKHGSFDPENFKELATKMDEGKTPWIAAHPFALDGKMKKTSIGPVYLAAKTGASLIPTALDISGGSVNLEGAIEGVKNLLHRSEASYRIGEPFKLPDIDVSIMERVFEKRDRGEEVSREELGRFTEVHAQLRAQADILADRIAELLPSEKRLEN